MPVRRSSHYYSVVVLLYGSEEIRDRVTAGESSLLRQAESYVSKSYYFGDDRNRMQRTFARAVEWAMGEPLAFAVYAWRDDAILMRVRIEGR